VLFLKQNLKKYDVKVNLDHETPTGRKKQIFELPPPFGLDLYRFVLVFLGFGKCFWLNVCMNVALEPQRSWLWGSKKLNQ